MQPKILVIRGGAIGDFLLTLPAIALLREAFPAARLEILGYQHIISLAASGGYADATRSIEYAALANFFNPKTADVGPGTQRLFRQFPAGGQLSCTTRTASSRAICGGAG